MQSDMDGEAAYGFFLLGRLCVVWGQRLTRGGPGGAAGTQAADARGRSCRRRVRRQPALGVRRGLLYAVAGAGRGAGARGRRGGLRERP